MNRLHYVVDPYVSHQRAAVPYIEILQRAHEVSRGAPSELDILAYRSGGSPAALCGEAVETADAVIIHAELTSPGWRNIILDLRRGGQKLIAYSVWEADVLPSPYVGALRHFDEIWTPSWFCQRTYRRIFPRTFRVPHVVDLPAVLPLKADDALEFLLFLKEGDPRKNPTLALSALDAVLSRWPKDWPRFGVNLVVRKAPDRWAGPELRPLADFVRRWQEVTTCWIRPSNSQIEDVYRRAHVLVSLHHGEGWGLTLSEAMARGVLVVASKWSGNLDFMSGASSFLVPGRVEVIRRHHRTSLLQPPMRWFYPDLDNAVRQIRRACRAWVEGMHAPYVQAGRRNLSRFSADAVAPLIQGRLRALRGAPINASGP